MRHYLEGSLFAVLFQLHHKFDPSIRLAGVDAAFVALGDAAGDGQADAETAGGGIAGGVGPVEAVEQLVQLLLRQRVAAVGYPQPHAPPGKSRLLKSPPHPPGR